MKSLPLHEQGSWFSVPPSLDHTSQDSADHICPSGSLKGFSYRTLGRISIRPWGAGALGPAGVLGEEDGRGCCWLVANLKVFLTLSFYLSFDKTVKKLSEESWVLCPDWYKFYLLNLFSTTSSDINLFVSSWNINDFFLHGLVVNSSAMWVLSLFAEVEKEFDENWHFLDFRSWAKL